MMMAFLQQGLEDKKSQKNPVVSSKERQSKYSNYW
jgi:hypothetical protein